MERARISPRLSNICCGGRPCTWLPWMVRLKLCRPCSSTKRILRSSALFFFSISCPFSKFQGMYCTVLVCMIFIGKTCIKPVSAAEISRRALTARGQEVVGEQGFTTKLHRQCSKPVASKERMEGKACQRSIMESENRQASRDIREFQSALQASKLPKIMRKRHPSHAVAVLVTHL